MALHGRAQMGLAALGAAMPAGQTQLVGASRTLTPVSACRSDTVLWLAWRREPDMQHGSEHGPGCDPRVALPAADPPDNLTSPAGFDTPAREAGQDSA